MNSQDLQNAIQRAQNQASQRQILLAENTLLSALNATNNLNHRLYLYQTLSTFYQSQQDFLGAALSFQKASSEAGQHPAFDLAAAKTFLLAGDPEQSIQHLKQIQNDLRHTDEFVESLSDAYRKARHWHKALETAREGLHRFPNSLKLKTILATSLAYLGEWEEADKIYRTLQPTPELSEIVAGALIDHHRRDEAIAILESGLDTWPDNPRLHKALAMTLWMDGKTASFLDRLEASLQKFPDNTSLHFVYADLLHKSDNTDKAFQVLSQLSEGNNDPAIMNALALLKFAMGNTEEAIALSSQSVELAPFDSSARKNTAALLLRAGEFLVAHEHTSLGLARNPDDQEWIALDVVAKRGSNDQSYRALYDYDRFVRAYTLPTPDGYKSLSEFLVDLAEYLQAEHIFSHHPLDQSLREGSQLALDPNQPQNPLVEKFFRAVQQPIAQYKSDVGYDPNHFFLKKSRSPTKIKGAWSVRLTTGGSHVNHIHPDGWVSSAFYVSLPECVTKPSNDHPGWIKFGEARFDAPGIIAEKYVQPEAGKLVLFPSFMWHGVNPFHEETERITIAFDIALS